MKLIGVSNFAREDVSDILVCENVNEFFGRQFETLLNNKEGKYSTYFYRLVPDDHTLYKYEP